MAVSPAPETFGNGKKLMILTAVALSIELAMMLLLNAARVTVQFDGVWQPVPQEASISNNSAQFPVIFSLTP